MVIMIVIVVMIAIRSMHMIVLVVRVGMGLARSCAGTNVAEQIRRDFPMAGHDNLRGRIDFAQANLDPLPGCVIEPVGLVEEDEIGVANLFFLHGAAPPRAGEIGAVDDEDHPADYRAVLQFGRAEMVEDFLGIGQARRLNPDEIEIGIVGQRRDLRDEVLEALAADATAGDAAQLQLAAREQRRINVDGAEIIDDDGGSLERHVGMGQPVAERGSFTATEKAGQQEQGEGLGARHAGYLVTLRSG